MNLPMKELEELITNPKKLSKLVLNHLINRLVIEYETDVVQGTSSYKATLLACFSYFPYIRATSNIFPILVRRILRSRSTVNQRIEQTHVIVIRYSKSVGANFLLTHFYFLSAPLNLSV